MTEARKLPQSVDELTEREKRVLARLSDQWHRKFKSRRDAVRESGRITAADLAIRINCRPGDR